VVTVTSTELRNHAKRFLDQVEKGQEFEIYRKGRPIAVLLPHRRTSKGRWKKANPLDLGGISLSKLILEERLEK
jgi:prevent-host-death family protein